MNAFSLVCHVKLTHYISDKLTPGCSNQRISAEGWVV